MNMEFFLSLYDEPQNSVTHINTKRSPSARAQDDTQPQSVSYLHSANTNTQINTHEHSSEFFSRSVIRGCASPSSQSPQSLQDEGARATTNSEQTPNEIARMIEETCERLESLSSIHHFEALSLFLAMTREEAKLIQKHHNS